MNKKAQDCFDENAIIIVSNCLMELQDLISKFTYDKAPDMDFIENQISDIKEHLYNTRVCDYKRDDE